MLFRCVFSFFPSFLCGSEAKDTAVFQLLEPEDRVKLEARLLVRAGSSADCGTWSRRRLMQALEDVLLV
jgi:hypothetical protein